MDFLNNLFLGIPLNQWLIALGIFAAVYLGFLALERVVFRRLIAIFQGTGTDLADLADKLVKRTISLTILVLAIYIGTIALPLEGQIKDIIKTATIVVLLIQVGIWGNVVVDFLILQRFTIADQDEGTLQTTRNALKMIAKFALWAIILLLVLENITGIETNTLIASLGIAGVAVALAVQNILGDLFSSLSIAIDKPFVIGDTIQIDGFQGTVERIGIKSTRLRSTTGEELVFANSDLLRGRLRNYRQIGDRQIVFNLAIDFNTPYASLKSLDQCVQQAVEMNENTKFDYAHFKSIGDYAYLYECSYTAVAHDGDQFIALRQAINLELVRQLEQAGIKLAYPTRTLILDREQKI